MSSSIIIVYFRPSAGGSGIPELIAFLNGTSISQPGLISNINKILIGYKISEIVTRKRHIYNVRTLLAKFSSCALAVSSGLVNSLKI